MKSTQLIMKNREGQQHHQTLALIISTVTQGSCARVVTSQIPISSTSCLYCPRPSFTVQLLTQTMTQCVKLISQNTKIQQIQKYIIFLNITKTTRQHMEEILQKLMEIHTMRLFVLIPCYTTLDPLSIKSHTLKIANMMENHSNLFLMTMMTILSIVGL